MMDLDGAVVVTGGGGQANLVIQPYSHVVQTRRMGKLGRPSSRPSSTRLRATISTRSAVLQNEGRKQIDAWRSRIDRSCAWDNSQFVADRHSPMLTIGSARTRQITSVQTESQSVQIWGFGAQPRI
jgi:hypothetical protein